MREDINQNGQVVLVLLPSEQFECKNSRYTSWLWSKYLHPENLTLISSPTIPPGQEYNI